jgi:hypothetical protein
MSSTSYLTPEVRCALQSGSLRNKEFSGDDRAALILMDYAGRARLKIYAHVAAVPLDADPALARLVADAGYRAKPERILQLHLMVFDWNCPQHISGRN